MLNILSIQEARARKDEFDEIWVLNKSIEYLQAKERLVPELTPSENRLDNYRQYVYYNAWDETQLNGWFKTGFLKDINSDEAKKALNTLFYITYKMKKNIALTFIAPKVLDVQTSYVKIIYDMINNAIAEANKKELERLTAEEKIKSVDKEIQRKKKVNEAETQEETAPKAKKSRKTKKTA